MANEKENNLFRVNEYMLLSVQEYNGTYSLIEGQIGHMDGNFHWFPCIKEIRGKKKQVPVSVRLGDRGKATQVLLWVLKIVTGNEYGMVK